MLSRLLTGSVALMLCATMIVANDANAQDNNTTDRRVIVSEGADYFGFDYRIVKDTTLANCKSVCLRDEGCRAFTYNTASNWCFLKSDFGELASAENSVAGRVVATSAPAPAKDTPPALTFLSPYYQDEADRYTRWLREQDVDPGQGAHALWQAGKTAMTSGQARLAAQNYRAALRLEPGVHALWIDLARSALSVKGNDFNETARLLEEATSASLNAYAISASSGERARSLAMLATALQRRQLFRPALEAYKASLLLKDTPLVREAYDKLHATHGFRLVDYSVDSESASPRICLRFSENLRTRGTDYTTFVTVDEQTPEAVEGKGQQICIDGAKHGERYRIGVRSGIPSDIGETLERASELSVYVRDRKPTVRFTGRNFVLPRFPGHGIPVVSVNTDAIKVQLLRIGERALVDVVGSGRLFDQLNAYSAEDLAEMKGEQIWQGELEVETILNREVTTRFPIDDALPERKPGVYVMIAQPRDSRTQRWQDQATQWFIVSDIGLSSLSGSDGLHVFARSLTTAGGLTGVELQLIARNNQVLATARTDDQGHALFDAGLIRGRGGMTPALVTAVLDGVDYAFLDTSTAGFDLSDRGVTGRPSPGPLDVYMYTERGVYRPGATVHVSALLRDRTAHAVSDIPLTFIFTRPDGVEHRRIVSQDQGLGGHGVDLATQTSAMQGTWRVAAHADPKSDPLSELRFLVEDFVPDRIEFDVDIDNAALPVDGALDATIAGRFLYGAPASGLHLEGELAVRATSTIKAFPGYSFGQADEQVLPVRNTLSQLPTTDAEGKATIQVAADQLPQTTRPLAGRLTVRMREGSGRAVERTLAVPIERTATMIGVRSEFKNGQVASDETARFSVIAVSPDDAKVDLAGLKWELVKIERNFQWYQVGGSWNYEAVSYTKRIADGQFDVSADQPSEIASRVDWGRYRLEVSSDDPAGPATSIEFTAGWYVEVAASDTPDMLEVTLDKSRYKPGETARVNLTPRFSGTALIMVVSDRLVDMKAVKVEAGGTTVDLTVDENWGAGAYVTATVFRPMDVAASRMPGRAIGLQWLNLDMSARTTQVVLDVPDIVRPRQPLDVLVKLPNLNPGDRAMVTLAAVDVGILNLTGYKPPAPQDWYFGQRALGVEFRDLYGQLIDGMQGVAGRIRSGGGEVGLGTKGSPPAQKPVALFSGIVEADGDGRATITFDVPAFNGTLRLMAVAWTKTGVGSGTTDVIVRDPVVVTASMPRFLAPGDTSRLRLDIDNTEGPDGEYQLSFDADHMVEVTNAEQTLTLAAGERTAIDVPMIGRTTGTGTLTFTISHRDGLSLSQTHALVVRAAQPSVSQRQIITLNEGARLTIGSDRLADKLDGTGAVSIAITRAGTIDVPSLLHSLDRYPYGCAEQTTSRALPLLYLSELAMQTGLGSEPEIRERIQKAIFNVLADQSSTGSFGLWGPGSGDLWLDAYVSDFLTRARELNYQVPERALTQALDNLQNVLGLTQDVKADGSGIAYGLYVLARNKRASLGDLRYYADTRLGEFNSALAKAQIGAALALYGENARATTAFRSATDALLHTAGGDNPSRSDYGSNLRDAAATLAFAAETKPATAPIPALVKFVSEIRAAKTYTSTQEKAWLLLAARALLSETSTIDLELNGAAHSGNLLQRLTDEDLQNGAFSVVNRSSEPLQAILTVTGVPDGPRPASGDGFEIERSYYTLDGRKVTTAEVGQNERFVVVLNLRELNKWPSRILVADLLPAGLEIDNPRLMGSADLKAFPWLQPSATTAHLEFRDDRFVAALDRTSSDSREFVLAYVVRAVTPGTYALPPALVEDMYRPHLNARTDMGRIEVIGPRP